MTCAIVSVPQEQRAFVTNNLAGFAHDVISGGGRVYVLSHVTGRENDLTFVDPFDGVLLIECRFFNDETAARQWAVADTALRTLQHRRVQ